MPGVVAGGAGSPDGHDQYAEAEDRGRPADHATKDRHQEQNAQDRPAAQECQDPGSRLAQIHPADNPPGAAVPERINEPQCGQHAEAEWDPDDRDQRDDAQNGSPFI
jgi:hypothetical protein